MQIHEKVPITTDLSINPVLHMAKKKKKGFVTRRQVHKAPEFELTRQNNAEFTRVGTANRVFRHALRFMIETMGDRYISGRVTRILFKTLQSDPIHDRGERTVIDGELVILEGFNFNRDTSLQNVLHAPYTVTLHNTASQATIELPSFIASSMMEAPDTATLFRFKAQAVALNFQEQTTPEFPIETELLEFNNGRQTLQLSLPIPEHNTYPIIVVLGIEFYQGKRGQYKLMNKKNNPMAVLKVFPAGNKNSDVY
jgi:hypothetical protein